jgi:hypothetical protein
MRARTGNEEGEGRAIMERTIFALNICCRGARCALGPMGVDCYSRRHKCGRDAVDRRKGENKHSCLCTELSIDANTVIAQS